MREACQLLTVAKKQPIGPFYLSCLQFNTEAAKVRFSLYLKGLSEVLNGGLAGTRTQDQRLKRPLLYRLSYQPTQGS